MALSSDLNKTTRNSTRRISATTRSRHGCSIHWTKVSEGVLFADDAKSMWDELKEMFSQGKCTENPSDQGGIEPPETGRPNNSRLLHTAKEFNCGMNWMTIPIALIARAQRQ